MKKFFKFLGILILLVFLLVLIMSIIAPKDVHMERSVVIKGDKAVVREQMFNYENFKNWNPFDDEDPNMKWEVTDGGKRYYWEGNNKVGSGEMTTTDQTETEKKYNMHFMKPFESKADGYYKVEDMGNGETKAIWGFNTHQGFWMAGISKLMGMEKMLTQSFDKGLNSIKEYVESGKAGPAPAADINIQEVQYPGGTYATIRKTIGWADMDKFFGDSYSALSQSAGQRINGIPVGLYYVWDEKNMQADVAAGFPVSGTEPVKGATMVTLPASGAYMVTYVGGYSGSAKVHEALGKHLGEKGKEMTLVLEEYVKSPGEETDSNKYVTNIYYLLK